MEVVDEYWPQVLLGLRVGVAALLYLFLLTAFNTLRRELHARARAAAAPVVAQAAVEPRFVEPEFVEAETEADAGDWLYVVRSPFGADLVGRSYPLDGAALVGRSGDSTIVLPESHVSARHARLERRDDRWWIEDLGSTNGTFIGGRRVTEPQPVPEDTPVRFGPVEVRLLSDAGA